jgi:putative sigma-54 modulation protein
MNIQITARHEKISKELQDALDSELTKLEKFTDKITSCHVVLDSEHLEKTAELVVNFSHGTATGKAKAENYSKAFDLALAKVERQLAKFNEKLKNHKSGIDKTKIVIGDKVTLVDDE